MLQIKFFALLAASMVSASSSFRNSQVPLGNKIGIYHRYLYRILQSTDEIQLSPACEAGNEELMADEDLVAANYTKHETMKKIDFMSMCNFDGDNNLKCEMDMRTFATADAYNAACEDAGGRIETIGMAIACDEEGITVEIVVNDNACIPSACSNEEVNTLMENVQETVRAGIPEGDNCRFTADNAQVDYGSNTNNNEGKTNNIFNSGANTNNMLTCLLAIGTIAGVLAM